MLEDASKFKNQNNTQVPKQSEMPKQVPTLVGGPLQAKNPPPLQMGKLNLQGLGKLPKEGDEEMKNDFVPQMKQPAPPMKIGGGFSLDISKATKLATSEDNQQDPTNEIDFK